ncbi:hypothetical protein BGW36DRAFT_342510 [Talaromyces proteolyticus]|uniref:BTB domain-containing protein n=1 Tax=Talaromyces proteolyticus TaxID=1131652 RepID=A0AAD4PX61_9EURO|nr:uncharacterized protein BGW36DRAFT_342510 [Talaromyces proteolyticus]KAH8696049.1 hypothetical protein BGW36DRAFT_342510 [Talaromyces proteolyticus]
MSIKDSALSTTSRVYIPEGSHRCRDYLLPTVNDGSHFFRSMIWDMYKTGKYSDFTIKVKGFEREFHVHRAVICPQSTIFEAACRGKFIEATTQSMTLVDDDPEIVERMIKYLYTHRYDDSEDWDFHCLYYRPHSLKYETKVTTSSESKHSRPFRLHTSTSPTKPPNKPGSSSSTPSTSPHPPRSLYVYAIADKYLIYPLKNIARGRFAKWANVHWSMPSFISAVREIFDNESGNYADLKEVVLAPMVQHADTLLSDQREETSNFLRDYSEVSVEILRRVLEQNRIAQTGLEVDISDLHSRIGWLKSENKKITMLQNQNHKLNKELLEIKMVVLAWKRDMRNMRGGEDRGSSGRNGRVGTSTAGAAAGQNQVNSDV